jgi:hypothetical protein
MVSFVKSQRGRKKLIESGYIYQRYDSKGIGLGISLWRCDRYKTPLKCPGRGSYKNGTFTMTNDHSGHAPSAVRVNAAKVNNKIRKSAQRNRDAPRTVVNQALVGASNKTIAALPKFASLQKGVTRRRRRAGGNPNIPHTLADIRIIGVL